ncbi:MAG: hypothetical protein QM744_12680 [Mesorhizobium sp.]
MTTQSKFTNIEPHAAIAFALDCVEPFEAVMFLRDWRDGKDVGDWIRTSQALGFDVAAWRVAVEAEIGRETRSTSDLRGELQGKPAG